MILPSSGYHQQRSLSTAIAKMSVRFKFKNDLDFSAIPCDGFHISVRDLKRAIVTKKRLGRVTDFDLDVINQQDSKAYEDEEALIPKNSTLVIVRRPLPPGTQKTWEDEKSSAVAASVAAKGSLGISGSNSSNMISFAASADEDISEEDRLNAMMTNSTEMYDQKNWIRFRGKALHGSHPPPKYVCMKCMRPGHWTQDCPRGEVKKTTGIPRSFLKPADMNTPGAKINPQGTSHALYKF